MTNREAWRKGYEHGFKGLYPVADYTKVGLAGSYHEGYKAGAARRKEPKGPKRNPKRSADLSWEEAERLGILKRAGIAKPKALAKAKPFRVTWHSSLKQKRVGFVRPIVAETKSGAIAIARSMIDNDPKAKAFVATEIRSNGIIEAAAGLQALDYFGGKAKRAGLGRKPKFNPRITKVKSAESKTGGISLRQLKEAADAGEQWAQRQYKSALASVRRLRKLEHKNPSDARFLLQIVTASGKREQFTVNTEKQAREIAASWYSRGASVTVIDRKKKTQTVYGKKNPMKNPIAKITSAEVVTYKDSGQVKAYVTWVDHRGKSGTTEGSPNGAHMQALLARAKREGVTIRFRNPRAKGSRDALGVWHAENPKRASKRALVGFAVAQAGKCELCKRKPITKMGYQGFRVCDVCFAKQKQQRRNPSVTDLSRTFQGDADGSIDRLFAADGAPANLARAGKLVFLKVKGKTFRIPGAVVAIAPNERLWITGKPPLFATKARKGEGLDVGEVTHICYETAKAHIGDGKTFEYVHEFGEDGGRRPHLIIDHEGMPILRGGDYKIRAEGIVN